MDDRNRTTPVLDAIRRLIALILKDGAYAFLLRVGWKWALGLVLAVVVLIGEAAALIYVRRLSRRVPAPRIAIQLTIVLWGLIICKGGSQVLGTGFMISIATGPPTVGGLFMTLARISWCTSIGGVVFGVWGLTVLFVLVRRLRAVSRTRATF